MTEDDNTYLPPSGYVKLGGGYPSEAQIRRLWAIAKSHDWSPKEVFDYCRANYDKGDVSELLISQYNELCNFMEHDD